MPNARVTLTFDRSAMQQMGCQLQCERGIFYLNLKFLSAYILDFWGKNGREMDNTIA